MEPIFVQKYGKHVISPEDIRTNKTVLKPYRVTRHRTDACKELSNQSDTGKGTEVVENTGKQIVK